MEEPIEVTYFNWLCAKVIENNNNRYISLMTILFNTEFVYPILADKHRAQDGLQLREDFKIENDLEEISMLEGVPCSVLEMLIAFSNRAEFQTEISARDWFWTFLSNLDPDNVLTQAAETDPSLIDDILYTFMWRIYQPNGEGGILPLHKTKNDQRKVELWYQFCEYVGDQGL